MAVSSFSTETPMKLTILNELGQVVKVISVEGKNNENYLVTDLPNGIYFLLGEADRSTMRLKLVVAR